MSRGCVNYLAAMVQMDRGAPFSCHLAAGDQPTRIFDRNGRVAFTVAPLYEEMAERLTQDLNMEAARRKQEGK